MKTQIYSYFFPIPILPPFYLLIFKMRLLEYTLDPEKIRKQDATSTIGSIASNVIGQPLAWDFVRARWEYLFES